MRRPDMCGDKHCLWAGVQSDFQQVTAVQTQDWPSVRVDVADRLQLLGKPFGSLEPRQQEQIVHLTRFAVLFVDGADFSGHYKTGCIVFARGLVRQAKAFP